VQTTLAGQLLVAKPTLYDSNFDHTVVLLLEHTDEGALGLVLNRPSAAELVEALPEWAKAAAPPAVVFVGGPVQQDAVIAIGQGPPDEREGWRPLFAGIGAVDLTVDEIDGVHSVRVFAGYAGWGPGQVEAELVERSWLVADLLPGDATSGDPDALWRAVVQRQGGTTAWLVNFPPHPSLN
jgi:putative transcriptional regulator